MEPIFVVTGAAGHLGSVIVQTLRKNGNQVRGLILPGQAPVEPGVEYICGNVLEPASLVPLFSREEGQPLYVIHTAGMVDITGAESEQLRRVNVTGTQNLIAASLQYRVNKFVYVSSVHAIPLPADGGVIRETDRFFPDRVEGGYAKSKAAATQSVLDAVQKGFPAVVVHPSGIVGPFDPGRNHLVQLIRDFMEGHLPACVPGGYDVVDVRDVAEGCILAMEYGRIGECYLLTGSYVEIKELLGQTAALCGKKPPVVLPMWLARAAEPVLHLWAKAQGIRPLYTRYALDTVNSNAQFSSRKACEELGYTTRPIQETIRDTVAWLQDNDAQDDVLYEH